VERPLTGRVAGAVGRASALAARLGIRRLGVAPGRTGGPIASRARESDAAVL